MATDNDSADDREVSDRAWSSWSQSDYDNEQWKRATILDHETGNTPKERYGLPVREPDGRLNRNGVHAAAARLAGAGGGVHAPAQAKRAAAAELLRLYSQIGDDPPESIVALANN